MDRRTFLRRTAVVGGSGLALATAGAGLFGYRTGYVEPALREPFVEPLSRALPPAALATAFTDVTVLPMDRQRRLDHHTVVTTGHTITAVGPDRTVHVPEDALVVRGGGGFLLPGLTDMHVHVQHPDELVLFVAAGVTAVRNMWGNDRALRWMGFPDQRELRDRIAAGSLLGPSMVTAGPILDGDPPTVPFMRSVVTPAQARREVAEQAAAGYDLVKVYDHLDRATFHAVLDEAARYGLPVAGHVPGAVGVAEAVQSGMASIEHLTGYLDPDAAALLVPGDRLAELATATAAAGVWNCPTFVIWQQRVAPALTDAEAVPPRIRRVWRTFAEQQGDAITYRGDDYTAAMARAGRRVVAALHHAGAGLLLGTDTDNANVVPGVAVLDELRWLVDSGLSPFDAIAAGTRNAAAALGRDGDAGVVAPGARADLLLTDDDPFTDVAALRDPVGVLLAGRWLDRPTLSRMTSDLIAWNRHE